MGTARVESIWGDRTVTPAEPPGVALPLIAGS